MKQRTPVKSKHTRKYKRNDNRFSRDLNHLSFTDQETSILDRLDQESRKPKKLARETVVDEIVETEQTYVGNLEKVLLNVIEPLMEIKEIQSDVLAVFSEWEIITELHKNFYESLVLLMNGFDAQETLLGPVFLKFIPMFKMYGRYCANYPRAQSLLIEHEENQSKFYEYLNNLERLYSIRIIDYLILPVQRVPRYSMLIDSLIKQTGESHPDFEMLEKSLLLTKNVADTLNHDVRKEEQIDLIFEIKERFDDTISFDALFEGQRSFVKEFEMSQCAPTNDSSYTWPGCTISGEDVDKKGRVVIFLFSDQIILATYISKTRLTFETSFELGTSLFYEEGECGIHIVNPRSTHYAVFCNSNDERNNSIIQFRKTLEILIKSNVTIRHTRQKLKYDPFYDECYLDKYFSPLVTESDYEEQARKTTLLALNNLVDDMLIKNTKLREPDYNKLRKSQKYKEYKKSMTNLDTDDRHKDLPPFKPLKSSDDIKFLHAHISKISGNNHYRELPPSRLGLMRNIDKERSALNSIDPNSFTPKKRRKSSTTYNTPTTLTPRKRTPYKSTVLTPNRLSRSSRSSRTINAQTLSPFRRI